MAKRVVVIPYSEQWKANFETIKQYLLTAIKDIIIGIEHIGSTSVESLSAKPIIDIDIVIKDHSIFDTVVERLATLGYIHEGNLGIKDREAFDYKGNADLPKHHLYVCPEFSAELKRHIAFRDYLRNNHEEMLKYSKVKEDGAKLFPDSIDDYIAYKSPCIEEIYKKCGLNKYKAIFFDRDGTLTYFTAEKEVWRDKQISSWSGKPFELDYDKMMSLFHLASEGRKPWYKTLQDEQEFFKRYYYHLLVGEGVTEDVENKAELLLNELWCNGDRALFSETVEVLEYFKNHGYKIGVISDTSPSLEFTLQQLGIAKYFTSFTASSLVGAGKPSPIIFNAALEAQGVTASESIFVDDCKDEADGARKQGFTSFYLDRSGKNNDEWTIHNLKQLINFVEGCFMIIQVENKEQLNICLDIIRNSFMTVTEEFGLTENNCPSHTAFMTIDKLQKQFDDDRAMFLFYKDEVPVGYFSLAKYSDEEWELNNLAVLPEYRHLGIGKAMVDYAAKMVKDYGGNKISIGIIEENTTLKNWYLKLGFNHISTRKFEHLPFTVGFMELNL